MKNDNFQRGDGDMWGIGALIVLGLIIWGVSSVFGFNFHGTSEGTADYSDCREVIRLEPNNWHTYFGTYIGTTLKTKSGRTMGGEFVRIENDKSLLSSSHTCARAYVYQKNKRMFVHKLRIYI